MPKRSLSDLNSEATKMCSDGDHIAAVAIYRILFTRAATLNLTHPELYICYSNSSAACLKLELFEEALEHAGHCARLAEASLRRYVLKFQNFIIRLPPFCETDSVNIYFSL